LKLASSNADAYQHDISPSTLVDGPIEADLQACLDGGYDYSPSTLVDGPIEALVDLGAYKSPS